MSTRARSSELQPGEVSPLVSTVGSFENEQHFYELSTVARHHDQYGERPDSRYYWTNLNPATTRSANHQSAGYEAIPHTFESYEYDSHDGMDRRYPVGFQADASWHEDSHQRSGDRNGARVPDFRGDSDIHLLAEVPIGVANNGEDSHLHAGEQMPGVNELNNSSRDHLRAQSLDTASQQEAIKAREPPWTETPWNPLCLHRAVLFCLSAIFFGCFLGTVLLYHFSQQYRRISTEEESRHYAWKYGPTAFLTAILYIWYSVDLSVRSLLPWQELQRGPRPAETTLLLDYISPLLTTSLWRALRNRHWAVVLTIIGRLLLLLTIAFSTALFMLEPTEMDLENAPLIRANFDTESFKLEDVDPFAADMYYGINFGDLVQPLGTSADTVVPLLATKEGDKAAIIPQSAALQADVTGLTFNATCEVLDIKNATTIAAHYGPANSANYRPDLYSIINITTPSCTINGVIVGDAPVSAVVGITEVQGKAGDYVCNLPWNYHDIVDAGLGAGPLAEMSNAAWTNMSADHRILLTVADVFAIGNGPPRSDTRLDALTVVLCNLSYVQSHNMLTYDRNSQTARIERLKTATDEQPAQNLPRFPQGILGPAVLAATDELFVQTEKFDEEAGKNFAQDPIFGLLELQSNISSVNGFHDAGLLKESFPSVFAGVATQLARQMFLNQSTKTSDISGTAKFTQERLHVAALSTGIMCAALGLLAIISAALVWTAPRNVVFSEPGSVWTAASLLTLSQDTTSILQGLGQARDKTIEKALATYHFATTNSEERGKLMIETSDQPHLKPVFTSSDSLETELRWWRPLGCQSWFLALSFVVPLVLLGLLEMFQRQSDENNGFVEIRSQWGETVVNYVPSLISIAVGAMFSSMVAACAVFAPFADMAKRPTAASLSIVPTYMTKTGPRLDYSSLRNKHFGLSIITLVQLVASVLTVVLSGLYSTVEVPFNAAVNFRQLDLFNISDTISVTNPNAGLSTKLMTYYGQDFPSWTYDSIVLPRVEVEDDSFLDETTNITITSRLQGLRGRINCTALHPSSSFPMDIVEMQDSPRKDVGLELSIEMQLPPSIFCDQSITNVSMPLMLHVPLRNDSTPTPFGITMPVQWYYNGTNYEKIHHGCPSFVMAVGQVTGVLQNKKKKEWIAADADFGLAVCWPMFEQFEVDVTFTWPGLEISQESPLVIDESTVKPMKNSVTNGTTWEMDYHAELQMWDSLQNSNDVWTDYGLLQENNTSFDPFILALTGGRDQIPLEDISGEDNVEALIEHAQSLWGRYMAQSISQNMRVDTANGSSITKRSNLKPNQKREEAAATFYPAQARAASWGSIRRLKQNAKSKLALQVMLGVMALGVVLMRAMTSFRKVLPHNPCSIAGTLTLVVDGNLKDASTVIIQKQPALKKTDGKYRKIPFVSLDHENQKVIMGWWNDANTQKFGVRYVENTD